MNDATTGTSVVEDADAIFTVGDSPAETDDEAIARLARLAEIDYARVRVAEAAKLSVSAGILDRLVKKAAVDATEATSGRTVALDDVEPWPEPVRLPAVLDDLSAMVRRHVVMPAEAADAIALWIAHTHVYEKFDYTPRLAITSPIKRCGKSTLLDVLRIACRRSLKADNVSASGIFRTVEALAPVTLLIDEADSFLPDSEELRGVLNSGCERSGQVIRVIELRDEHRPVAFRTFAPAALAAIGELPATIADRAVPIRLARKAASEAATRLRVPGARPAIAELARKLTRWTADEADRLGADPAIPDALGDREGDISVPLLSIADAAGPAWAVRGRRALLAAFGLRAADGEGEAGAMLLADLRALFAELSALRLHSADICERLAKMEDRPWPEWRHGKPITPRQLAVALSPFGIKPAALRIGTELAKGYYAEAFAEVWERYLPGPDSRDSSIPPPFDP